MWEIISREILAKDTVLLQIDTPDIAKNTEPGQFVVVMVNEQGERIPLTIADFNRKKGTITIVFKILGRTTCDLSELNEGDRLFNITGPLGKPSQIKKSGNVVMIGGGIGIALIYPIAKAMKEAGNNVISIIGAQSKGLLFWEEKMKSASSELIVMTDDGSSGRKGFVTDVLRDLLEKDKNIGLVFAVGPVVMMRAVAEVTKPRQIKTIVSLNSIMVDGTGMCGSCRVEVAGKTKFACVDGPDFDAHEVNFEILMKRQEMYLEQERMVFKNKCQK